MANPPFSWREPFLTALRHYPVAQHACDVVGINRTTAWRARQADAEFARAWDEAEAAGVDRAEREAFRRAVDGFEEPLTHKGQITYQLEHYDAQTGQLVDEQVYADNLLRPAEAQRPLRWRYKRDAAGQPMPVTIRKHSDQLLALILKGRRKALYSERTELTGADGGAVTVDDTARAARLARLLDLAQARKDAEQFG